MITIEKKLLLPQIKKVLLRRTTNTEQWEKVEIVQNNMNKTKRGNDSIILKFI